MKSLPKIVMIIAALLLLGVFFFPLWKISLYAPQYPDGINMYIWVNQITGDTDYTLQNINILNHYIGMQYIEPESIPELTYFPYIVAAVIALGIGAAFTGKKKIYWAWAALLIILGGLGIYDFYLWEYDYGHNLDPNAAIKIPGMVYQPPLIGQKWLLNFDARSWPNWGSLFLALAPILAIVAGFLKKKEEKAEKSTANSNMTSGKSQTLAYTTVVLLTMLVVTSCSTGPQPIYYGEENCQFCQMTIVDQRYAAQIVTDKGKAYNFDAIECMINFREDGTVDPANISLELVNTFDKPGELANATEVTYIHTKALPSPMGMNITAFRNLSNVPEVEAEVKEFSWTELNNNFNKLSDNLVIIK